jgi:hypothetical protein
MPLDRAGQLDGRSRLQAAQASHSWRLAVACVSFATAVRSSSSASNVRLFDQPVRSAGNSGEGDKGMHSGG